jgi:hypothetical protein
MGVTRTKVLGSKTKVFIPFPTVESTQHIQSSQGWNNVLAGDIFCIDDGNLHTHLNSLAGPTDVLYIRGHCSSGTGYLESSSHSKWIYVPDLVDALKGHLQYGFQGIIKIYACESSVDYKVIILGTWKSFAQKFANQMYGAKYRSCQFWGYKSAVTTFSSVGAGGQSHKWAAKDGFVADEETGPDQNRASVSLVRIYPEIDGLPI